MIRAPVNWWKRSSPTRVASFPSSVACLHHYHPATSSGWLSAPRSWWCFLPLGRVHVPRHVRPTLVGVLPVSPMRRREVTCPPHARGGAFDGWCPEWSRDGLGSKRLCYQSVTTRPV